MSPTDGTPAPTALEAMDGFGHGTSCAPFTIVGIGASAGGLAAFTKLLQPLTIDSGMAFIFIQHLDPRHASQLATILAKGTVLPVIEATEGMVIAPNHIYIIPPNANMAINQGALCMSAREMGRGGHLSIDFFLRSLALDCPGRCIGVILSGHGSDGTLGMAEIKAANGITFAQDPQSSEFSEMPSHATSYGCADFVLTPQEIAEAIMALGAKGIQRAISRGLPADPFPNDADYPDVVALLKSISGVDFNLYRPSTIKRRILRRMMMRNLTSLKEYLGVLSTTPGELSALHKDVLINVTSFFRDQVVFNALKTVTFPRLMAERLPDAPLRIWVVACSTGEEVYSLAIELIEFFSDSLQRPAIQIFATDISETSLAIARTAVYPSSIESEVPPDRLDTYFSKFKDGYRLNKSIRDMCVFAQHDVTADTPFSKMDVISCRNVLIYLTPVLQLQVISTFHFTLNVGGYLILGASESVGSQSAMFETADAKNRVYRKKITAGRQHPPSILVERRGTIGPTSAHRLLSRGDVQQAADRLVLNRYGPPGVLVDDQLNIIQFRGKIKEYLEPTQGEASLNLARMLPFGLVHVIKEAVAIAKLSMAPVLREHLRLSEEESFHELDVEVSLIRIQGTSEVSFLVLFLQRAIEVAPTLSIERKQMDSEVRDSVQLRQELSAAKGYLQSLIEENNIVNDDLRFANDEALSSNEELRCTNEELQTAREEMESSNEELRTVNDELLNRNLERDITTNDLNNLLDAVDLPIVMLDRDLRIRKATHAAEKALGLNKSDIGRALNSARFDISRPVFERILNDVIDTRTSSHREVQDVLGHWFSMRVTPYRVENEGVDGVVITLIDIDGSKRDNELLRIPGDFAKAIVDSVRDPLLVLDTDLCVHSQNKAFERVFQGLSSDVGRNVFSILNGAFNIAAVRTMLGGILVDTLSVDDFEVTHEFAHIGRRTILLNARLLIGTSVGKRMIVLVMLDITDKKKMADDLKVISAELRRSNAELDQFAAVASHDLQEPLRMITSYASLLQNRLGASLDAKCTDYIGYITNGTSRMYQLIKAILDYSHVGNQGIERSSVEVEVVLRSAMINLERKIHDGNASISFGPLPIVRADPVLLLQLWQNLISNAIKFHSKDRLPLIAISADENVQDWVFAIADNGIGIRAEDTERIFTLFQRIYSVADYPGTGIGLATCKKIVERHNGRLWVESTVDVGTTFFFSLPKL